MTTPKAQAEQLVAQSWIDYDNREDCTGFVRLIFGAILEDRIEHALRQAQAEGLQLAMQELDDTPWPWREHEYMTDLRKRLALRAKVAEGEL